MKKSIKGMCAVLAMVLSAQGIVFAKTEVTAENKRNEETVCTTFAQPRGLYLMGGGCSITPGSNSVKVNGYTESYEAVEKAYVTLTVYQEISAGVWEAVWTYCYLDEDTDYAYFPTRTIWVDSGYNYKVEGEHTIVHNGRTETNYSETGGVYVG